MQGSLPLLWAGRVTDISAVSPTAGGKVDEGPGANPAQGARESTRCRGVHAAPPIK
jgi:hypothetical protein